MVWAKAYRTMPTGTGLAAVHGPGVPPGGQVAVAPLVAVRVAVGGTAVLVRVAVAGVMHPPPACKVYKREPVEGVPTPLQKSCVKLVLFCCTPPVAEPLPGLGPKMTSNRLGAASYSLNSN